ncbi:hypothetical protein HMPREF0043_02272 [Actinobaculum sp. oral taxon 183 str. F0552]|jgi:hypothetical protein|uniref:hypothetical protein n=1 Tax=Actinobaculum sp. oral taxon 183 TaxID=712888 RepID=UPI0003965438|nr:hypothetical protein [Actinobaculum sp. oral taxon 183]ERH14300.1 hypothetical protein HMPREF0043_02272 [Actinobaculum sp. oral taxon 183 str. F0552]RKV67287.1 MAG: hypothetical protein D8B44_06640 [Actinomyces sp.]
MFLSAGSLKDVLPLVEEMTRGPGKSLVRTAALVDSTLLALGALLARRGVGAFSVLVLALGAVFGAGILVFAIRRARLESRVEEWKRAGRATVAGEAASSSTDYSDRYRDAAPSDSHEVVVIDGAPRSDEADPADDRARAARAEAGLRDTWMPRIDAAQRSAIAAAGGVVNAPYLRDDLRITILSALVAAVAVPVGSFFAILAVLALL